MAYSLKTTVISQGALIPKSGIIRCCDLQSNNSIPVVKIINNTITFVKGSDSKKMLDLKDWIIFSEEISQSNFWLDAGKTQTITNPSLKINGFLGITIEFPKGMSNINGSSIHVCPTVSASYVKGDFDSDFNSDFDNGYFTITNTAIPIKEGWELDVINTASSSVIETVTISSVENILSGRKIKVESVSNSLPSGSCTLRIKIPVYLVDNNIMWVEYDGNDWVSLPSSISIDIDGYMYYWRVLDKLVPYQGYMLSVIKTEYDPTVFIGNAYLLWRKVGDTTWQTMGNLKIDTGTILCPVPEIEIKNPHPFSVKVNQVIA